MLQYWGNSYGFAASPTSGIVTSGLRMNLDASYPASYSGSGSGTWNDISGNGAYATLAGSPAYTSDKGGGIVFASAAHRSLITSPNAASLSGGFGLELWLKPTAISSIARYLSLSSLPGEGPVIRGSSSSVQCYFFDQSFSLRSFTSGSIATNNYYQLFYTYDGSNSRLYRNGTQAGILSGSFTLPTVPTGNTVIGFLSNDGTEFFYGIMYVVNYYNRGVSASEVLQNFNAIRGRFGI